MAPTVRGWWWWWWRRRRRRQRRRQTEACHYLFFTLSFFYSSWWPLPLLWCTNCRLSLNNVHVFCVCPFLVSYLPHLPIVLMASRFPFPLPCVNTLSLPLIHWPTLSVCMKTTTNSLDFNLNENSAHGVDTSGTNSFSIDNDWTTDVKCQ